MPTTEFDTPLDEEALEWVRYRFTTEGGTVTAFTVQYETTLDGRRLPGNPTPGEALQRGAADIRKHWRRYREAFLRGSR